MKSVVSLTTIPNRVDQVHHIIDMLSNKKKKYKVDSPSMYGGSCPCEFEMESTICSAVPCQAVNCTLSPSGKDWGDCTATKCGTKGSRTRPKYKVDSPSMYGGTCDDEFEEEEEAIPSTIDENKKMYIIIGM
jgi:hypothetical protein